VRLLQPLFCTGRGRIVLKQCNIGVQPSPHLWDGYCHIEAREASASVHIDPDVWLNNRATLIAERSSIRIERGCLIGPGVQIFDSDFHGLEPATRRSGQQECAAVHLQENVFVGASAIILKGVTVGRNSVVASGAVVTRDVPSDCIVAGSPARTIRRFIAVEGPLSVEVSSHRGIR
jgi:maltose O-acetyltransferase